MDSLVTILITVAIMIVAVGVMLLVALTRKGSVTTTTMTARRIVLHLAASPDVVYALLSQECPSGYSVEDVDPSRGLVILSSRPTAFTWGFFYPVVVSAEGAGARVEIGIKSKVFQYGPLVTRAHRKLAHAVAGFSNAHIENG